jgi:hypothetical protein
MGYLVPAERVPSGIGEKCFEGFSLFLQGESPPPPESDFRPPELIRAVTLPSSVSIQNYVDKALIRSVKFQGDQIILGTPPTLVNGKIPTVALICQRLPGGS